jgi:hypothetical protein
VTPRGSWLLLLSMLGGVSCVVYCCYLVARHRLLDCAEEPKHSIEPMPLVVVECQCGGWDEIYDACFTSRHERRCPMNAEARL